LLDLFLWSPAISLHDADGVLRHAAADFFAMYKDKLCMRDMTIMVEIREKEITERRY
jgi:hypothetical protein